VSSTNYAPSAAYVYGITDQLLAVWNLWSGISTYRNYVPLTAHMLTYGSDEQTKVTIGKVGTSISSVYIRPKSKNYQYEIVNGSANLYLSSLDKAWITINNEASSPLFIFCDPPKPPIPTAPQKFSYFGPGIHYLSALPGSEPLTISGVAASGQFQGTTFSKTFYGVMFSSLSGYEEGQDYTIYFDGGAYVIGTFDFLYKNNIKLIGPGILSQQDANELKTSMGYLFSSGPEYNYDPAYASEPRNIDWIEAALYSPTGSHNAAAIAAGKRSFSLGAITTAASFFSEGTIRNYPTPSGIVVSGVTLTRTGAWGFGGNELINVKQINPWYWQGGMFLCADKSTKKLTVKDSFFFICDDLIAPINLPSNSKKGFILNGAPEVFGITDPDFGGEQIYENLQLYTICSPINVSYYERYNDLFQGGTYPVIIKNIDAGCYRNLFQLGTPVIDFPITNYKTSTENMWPFINIRTYNSNLSKFIEDQFPYLRGSFGTYDVTISSIRIEDPTQNQLFFIGNINLPASFEENGYFPLGVCASIGNGEIENKGPYGSVSGILISDIDFSSSPRTPTMARGSLMFAGSLDDKPSNITLKNIKLNGQYLTEENFRNYVQLSGPISLEANNISVISPSDDFNFEVVGMDDITKSPLDRFTCATNDGEFIYAGSDSVSGNGHVWKYSPYQGWIRITDNLNNSTAKSISTIKYHDGKLYAGTQGSSLAYGTGQLWINAGNGQGWTNPLVYWAGSTNVALRTLLFKDGDLYTAGSYFDIAKYSSAGNWSEVFGYANNFVAAGGPSSVITHDLETDGTNIYAAMSTLLLSSVVMKYDGAAWTRISPYGFGDFNNAAISKLKWHNNKLYAATFNQSTGSEIWQYDGSNWQQINIDGFGRAGNFNVVSMQSINNKLIVSVEGIYGGQILTYSEEDGWLDVILNSDVVYASYLIERVGNKNYLIGTRRKNLITKNEPTAFITYEMKEQASANYFPDGQLGMIPLEDNKYRFFGPNALWQYVSDGPIDNPFETVRSTLQYSKALFNYNPAKLGYTAGTDFLEKKNDFAYYNPSSESDPIGLPNVRYNSGGLVHQIPNTSTVIVFTHCEEGYWEATSVSAQFGGIYWNGVIRQGVSFDNGLSIYDCGRLIESSFPARPNTVTVSGGTGLGLGGYVIKNGYIYLYYHSEVFTSGPPIRATTLSVARAVYSEFIDSAINKQICSWQKYYNGSFSQPGINGSSTDLTDLYGGNVGWSLGINSSSLNNVCYFISNKIYYIDYNSFYTVNTNYPWDPEDPDIQYSNNWDLQSHVLFSEDGINWSFPERISSFDNSCIYTFPLSFSGHIGELSNEFKILGQRSAPWTYTDQQGGINTKQQIVEVQPFRDVERGFTEGTYFNLDFTIFAKSNGQWKKSVPYCKINNSWKFAYPFLKSPNNWIESTPIRQGKEEVDLYFYIGDSVATDAVGSSIDFLSYNEYSGLYSSVPGCHIFRVVECPQTTGEFGAFTSPRFEKYRTGVNTNSINSNASGYAGADIVLFDKLRKSSNNDVYVLKGGWPGSRFVKESGYFDWSPRSQNSDLFGDLFKIYYDYHIVPGLNWLKSNNKNPIFKGGFITLGTNAPTYVFKEEFTKEQVDIDCSGLVSGLIDCFKSNNINTENAKIIWIAPDRVRILAGPYLTEPYKSSFSEYLNATVSAVLNLSTIFNFTSGYDPSAWYQLSGNNDYVHPSTSGHVKVAETVFNNFFYTGP
jgi:hypothetical protein